MPYKPAVKSLFWIMGAIMDFPIFTEEKHKLGLKNIAGNLCAFNLNTFEWIA